MTNLEAATTNLYKKCFKMNGKTYIYKYITEFKDSIMEMLVYFTIISKVIEKVHFHSMDCYYFGSIISMQKRFRAKSKVKN